MTRREEKNGVAHFTCRSKTGQRRYFLLTGPAPSDRTEVTFPQGTKSIGRVVALPSGPNRVTT